MSPPPPPPDPRDGLFQRVLARLAAQVLLGIAVLIWGVIALLDVERASARPWFGAGALLALASLVGLARGSRWMPWTGAIALLMPIGVLAHGNGASPWLWLFWALCAWGTERWMRMGCLTIRR